MNAGLFLTAQTAELLSLRISDILEYSPTKEAFISTIGSHNTAILDELSELHLYDFGIFIDLTPDDEERQLLENNIQVALQANLIELADAIDLREIKNIKLANQLLKIRREKKLKKDQAIQQENIKAQAQANAQSQQVAAQAEVQKNAALTQQKAQLIQIQNQADVQKLQAESDLKKQLMQLEFEYNMRLKGVETEGQKSKEKEKEDRKDERTRIQASQQSELIEQRKTGSPPKKFESSGNDILGGGVGLDKFNPQIGN